VRIETATTDPSGNFRFPRWRGDYPNSFYTYKAGYVFAEMKGFGPLKSIPNPLELQVFSGTTRARLEELRRLTARTWCDSAAETGTQENLLPLWRTIYEEARSIAQTREDEEQVDFFLTRVEEIVLGWQVAEKRRTERENTRKGR
jgi:hypothetical protein